MRDYSFGNFISVLRERSGLSQYQLGVLVGVSDKAVSKWENGVSKPRIGTIRKLSEILDVSVDELLTCECAACIRERKDLFALKNRIMEAAQKRMKELYGEHPPVKIANRFKTEELMLHDQEALLWMGFMGQLQKTFAEADAYFDVRGAQMGASFVAWLLGGTEVNPLPAHYYCPTCKRVEFLPDEKCGLDAPDKKCACGTEYQKDGFAIDAVNMYPLPRNNEIYVSKNATGIVKSCLKSYFEGCGEICELDIRYGEGEEISHSDSFKVTKYVLFSLENARKYPEDRMTLMAEEYYGHMGDWSVLNVIENTEEEMGSRDVRNVKYTKEQIKAYARYAVEQRAFCNEYTGIDLCNVISDMENPKFSDLLVVSGFLHGTDVWTGNAEDLYNQGIPLDALISFREDIYSYLYKKMNGICCDNPVGQAFEIKENVRKGKYSSQRMPAEIEKLLLESDVPKWYVESMKKIRYLFPKTHMIVILKREICRYITMKPCERK